LISGAIGLGAAASLGAAAAAAAVAQGPEERALSAALELERAAVIAYRQALATNVLTSGARAQLQVLVSQELAHAGKLEQVLAKLAAPIPQGPATVPAAEALLARHQVHRSLTDLPSQSDCLRLLIDVESLTEGAYFAAMPELTTPALMKLGLELMGSDAQHWAVLSGIQHGGDIGQSVPYPFVAGSP
jgi:rubrerythrin